MLVEAVIAQICMGLSGPQLQACHKALEATGAQTHISQNVSSAEQATTQMVYKRVSNVTGDAVIGIAGAAAKVIRDKRIVYPIVRHPDGLIPAVSPSIGTKDGHLDLKWEF